MSSTGAPVSVAAPVQASATVSAVEGGDATAADADHKILVSKIDKAIKRGAIHKNSGARKKSRAARTRAKLSA